MRVSRNKKRIMRRARQETISSLATSLLFVFKICSMLVVVGSFVSYLVKLPDSGAYFTSLARSDPITFSFSGKTVQQTETPLIGIAMSELEPELEEPEQISEEEEPEAEVEIEEEPEDIISQTEELEAVPDNEDEVETEDYPDEEPEQDLQ